ncbi:ATP-binding protein [Candidatus Woesearchaeota archaeon]|nr:ATP-binding protein [Candidatus Woesearchaeota archaeon]
MKRKLYQKLLKEKDSKKISIIIGPRQVGKTTLLKQLHEELGGLYVDFDILENVERFETYTKFINSLQLEGYNEKKQFCLFIDEFQKYTDLTKILKNIYDNHKNIKIYATGSSSITIKNNIQESLAGRKILHKIYPLDFEEFLTFKEINPDKLERLTKFKGDLPKTEYKKEIEEFMQYGGYPEVVLSKNKKEILASIFDTFIKKDLVDYLNIKEILGVKKLIQYLAINNGGKLNITDISQQLNLTREQIENYLEVLEETFILKRVTPFFTNKNKEIVKAYKEYFIDPGVRNYFCNNFNEMNIRNDRGFLFETFILGEIIKNSDYEIKFWQDKQKHEVDFIIDKIHEQIGLEIKYKEKLKAEDYQGIKYIKEKIKRCYIINLIKQDEKHILPFSTRQIVE